MTLLIGVALIVVGLHRGVRSKVGFDNRAADDTVLVILLHGSYVEQQVLVENGGVNYAEHSDTYAYTLRMDVVEDVGCAEEGVVVDLQTVVLLQRLEQILVDLGGVGTTEHTVHVVHLVIDLIALNAVVVLDTLQNVVADSIPVTA